MIGAELLKRYQSGGDIYTAITGSEWCEAVVCAGTSARLTDGAGRHGHPTRWDWGVTIKSLALACQRYDCLCNVIAEMDASAQAAMWSDPDMDELRRVAIRERHLNTQRRDLS